MTGRCRHLESTTVSSSESIHQDYFSMAYQKAEQIVKILRDQVFTLVGPPQQLHSGQGKNYENYILAELWNL